MSEGILKVRDLRFLERGPYSFDLERGECVGLVGESGVGKTQLFRAIADLIPSTGEVCFEAVAKELVTGPEWRAKVTLLPTDSAWWFETVGEHFIANYLQEAFVSDCEKLGLSGKIGSWQVARLSTGEKQRLALLRTLQIGLRVLLLDEPTSGLDSVNTAKVEALLEHHRKSGNLSLLWVSHDRDQLARVCTRILRMEKNGICGIQRQRENQ